MTATTHPTTDAGHVVARIVSIDAPESDPGQGIAEVLYCVACASDTYRNHYAASSLGSEPVCAWEIALGDTCEHCGEPIPTADPATTAASWNGRDAVAATAWGGLVRVDALTRCAPSGRVDLTANEARRLARMLTDTANMLDAEDSHR